MSETWVTAVAAVVSTLIAGAGLLVVWFRWRNSELRHNDVLAWSNDVIGALQTLLLICIIKDPFLDEKTAKAKLADLIFEISILVERGRLFFKNEVIDQHGADKAPAYRGYRPEILDPIVVAHQIARGWFGADDDRKLRMRLVADDCLKKFVSFAQEEVGRDRTSSANTKKGGDGANLWRLLSEVDDTRLEKLKESVR